MNEFAAAWDSRIAALVERLPARAAKAVRWLREPSRRLVRFGAGILFIVGGIFSILPILGIWMLPLGLALLAEDLPGLKPVLERSARWIERHWRRLRGRPDTRDAGPEVGGQTRAPTEPAAVVVRPPSGA
jgi:hypothetical protein